jgi:hypothetical protein
VVGQGDPEQRRGDQEPAIGARPVVAPGSLPADQGQQQDGDQGKVQRVDIGPDAQRPGDRGRGDAETGRDRQREAVGPAGPSSRR